jgi:hypothetical protein
MHAERAAQPGSAAHCAAVFAKQGSLRGIPLRQFVQVPSKPFPLQYCMQTAWHGAHGAQAHCWSRSWLYVVAPAGLAATQHFSQLPSVPLAAQAPEPPSPASTPAPDPPPELDELELDELELDDVQVVPPPDPPLELEELDELELEAALDELLVALPPVPPVPLALELLLAVEPAVVLEDEPPQATASVMPAAPTIHGFIREDLRKGKVAPSSSWRARRTTNDATTASRRHARVRLWGLCP